jgi:hypothetical protein
MTVDPKQSISDLTVVVKRAVVSEELAVSGSIAVRSIDESNVVENLASDQVE